MTITSSIKIKITIRDQEQWRERDATPRFPRYNPPMPPRVVHVYKDVYPPVEGGIERTIYHLCSLTRPEFAPSVIVASRGRAGGRREIAGGVEVVEVPSLGRALSTPLAPGFIAALRASRADLFHFHFPHPTGEMAYLLSGLKTPAVVTYHSDIVRQKAALALYRPFMRAFLSRMKFIMPTSERYMKTSETLAPHADRCRVVPLGLPLEDYALNDSRARLRDEFRARLGEFVFFIGVLRYYKGLAYLIEAMAQVPGANLVIAGAGPEEPRLREAIRARAAADPTLPGRVHFLGKVDHDSAVALFHAGSIFSLPACERSEAYGLCQIEALACGLPIVSTNLPTGVPEINRHETTGLIVPPKDSRALAEAIQRLLRDPHARRRMGEAGRLRAEENYTARRMADRVMEVYREALG